MKGTWAVLAILCTATNIVAAQSHARSLALLVGEDAELHGEVSLQLAEWDVNLGATPRGHTLLQRAALAQTSLEGADAATWIETAPDGVERLVVVTPLDESPRLSPLPNRSTPDWPRVVALVLDGLLASGPQDARVVLATPPEPPTTETPTILSPPPRIIYRDRPEAVEPTRPGRWPAPTLRTGWNFAFGWAFAMTPREDFGFGAYTEDGQAFDRIAGGLRLRVGRWITPFLRADLAGHVLGVDSNGPEGALSLGLSLVSRTRLRMGAGAHIGMMLVSERDQATGGNFGWLGYFASFPMEIGLEWNRRSGIIVQIGPTFIKPPYLSRVHPGMLLSMEAEFDFGRSPE